MPSFLAVLSGMAILAPGVLLSLALFDVISRLIIRLRTRRAHAAPGSRPA